MSEFYTNVFQRGNKIYLRGYKDGVVVREKIDYKPYLFAPAGTESMTPYRTLYGVPMVKRNFDTIQEANKFLETHSDISNFHVHGLTDYKYLFIYDRFHGEIEYDPSLINVISLDIETDSSDGWPDIDSADKAITAITLSRRGVKKVFGVFPYKTTDDNVEYIHCIDEHTLLTNFLQVWRTGHFMPDIVTGWNIEFFDIPYLVNRINRILGTNDCENPAKYLSPWNLLTEKQIEIRGKTHTVFNPLGISVLDYYPLYKKFKFETQESYRLENIAQVENLPIKKLDYKAQGYTSLDDMYKRNFQLFIDYNIQDTTVIDLLEEKLKFIEQVMALAYDAKVNYNDTLATVKPWDIIIHNYLLDRAIVIPQFKRGNFSQNLAGGYVKEPKIGMSKWVVSFDLTSSYPNQIIQYNISPETFRGREQKFKNIDDLIIAMRENNLSIDGKYAFAANGTKYDKDRQGFLPSIMKKMLDDRAKYKTLMLESKKHLEKLEDEIKRRGLI